MISIFRFFFSRIIIIPSYICISMFFFLLLYNVSIM